MKFLKEQSYKGYNIYFINIVYSLGRELSKDDVHDNDNNIFNITIVIDIIM